MERVTKEQFVAAARAAGIDNLRDGDVRDAAHEIFHAQAAGVRGKWDREKTHRALVRKFRGAKMWLHEVDARVLEDIVSEMFGHESGRDVDAWLSVSVMEAIKSGMPWSHPDDALRAYMKRQRPRLTKVAEAMLVWAAGAKSIDAIAGES